MPRLLLAAAALMLLVTAGSAAPVAAPPNVVLVLIDDMGWGDFSCFGNQEAETANIDRLAAEGLRFDAVLRQLADLLAVARRRSRRASIRSAGGSRSFLNNRAQNERRGMAQWLDPRRRRWPACSSSAGYATGHFGKWHLGGQRDVGDAPLITEYGFDASLTNFEGLGARVLPLFDRLRRQAAANARAGLRQARPRRRSRGKTARRSRPLRRRRDRVHRRARQAADSRSTSTSGRTTCTRRSFRRKRTPRRRQPARAVSGRARDDGRAAWRAVRSHSRQRHALRDNTLILVCSDNGPEPGAGSAGPFRGHKATLYEGGIRSPLIVWGPGLMRRPAAARSIAQSFLAAIDSGAVAAGDHRRRAAARRRARRRAEQDVVLARRAGAGPRRSTSAGRPIGPHRRARRTAGPGGARRPRGSCSASTTARAAAVRSDDDPDEAPTSPRVIPRGSER